MALLPPETNSDYRGAESSARFLLVLAVLQGIPALIHLFLPDGGAGVIAGLDFGTSASTIIGIFAWAGATQLVHGLSMGVVALRYRPLVPLFLALVLLERVLMSLNWWVLKPPASGHRPPEVWATLALMPLVAFFLARSLPGSRTGRGAA